MQIFKIIACYVPISKALFNRQARDSYIDYRLYRQRKLQRINFVRVIQCLLSWALFLSALRMGSFFFFAFAGVGSYMGLKLRLSAAKTIVYFQQKDIQIRIDRHNTMVINQTLVTPDTFLDVILSEKDEIMNQKIIIKVDERTEMEYVNKVLSILHRPLYILQRLYLIIGEILFVFG